MTEPHPIMALLLEHNTFLGQGELPENEIQPLDSQLNFGPGDAAILAGSNLPVERDFTVVRALEPEEYADTFPDWEERMLGTGPGWSSHVLVELFSRADPEITVGWVSRVKLMVIPKYRYKEARKWMKEGFPSEMPDWCDKVYRSYTAALAERAPNLVPVHVECPNCHQHEMELLVVRRIKYQARAGRLGHEEKVKYVPLHPPDEDDSHTAQLHCTQCGQIGDLVDEEWLMPDITH